MGVRKDTKTTINPGNHNFRAILKKMGFQQEAYFRENYFYNGAYLDSEIYALLSSDFINGVGNKD